jgi:transposase
MDWGFIMTDSDAYVPSCLACFVMVYHYCGNCYIESFPNANQENLFIGMLHAFSMLGVPRYVLTDNMKSAVIRRNYDGSPVWQKNYKRFMNTVVIETKLCFPRHPFTKGA